MGGATSEVLGCRVLVLAGRGSGAVRVPRGAAVLHHHEPGSVGPMGLWRCGVTGPGCVPAGCWRAGVWCRGAVWCRVVPCGAMQCRAVPWGPAPVRLCCYIRAGAEAAVARCCHRNQRGDVVDRVPGGEARPRGSAHTVGVPRALWAAHSHPGAPVCPLVSLCMSPMCPRAVGLCAPWRGEHGKPQPPTTTGPF